MHAFLLSSSSIHSYIFVFYLVDSCGVPKENLKIIFFDAESKKDLMYPFFDEIFNVFYCFDIEEGFVFSDVSSVTVSSLNYANSKVIWRCVQDELFSLDQLIVRITDDEVDRWKKLYDRCGDLRVDAEAKLDEYSIKILGGVNNYICLRSPWGEVLEEMLRRDIDIIDVFIDANKFLDQDLESFFYEKISTGIIDQLENSGVFRVMVISKPNPLNQQLPYLMDVLRFALFYSDLLGGRVLELCMWRSRRGLLMQLIYALVISSIFLVSRLKRVRVRFDFQCPMPKEVYFSRLASCHVLLGQDRGGLGAANEALKFGSFLVYRNESLNSKVFEAFNIPSVLTVNKGENSIVKCLMLFKSQRSESVMKENKHAAFEFFNKKLAETSLRLREVYGNESSNSVKGKGG